MKISLLFASLLSGLSVALLFLLPTIPVQAIGKSFFRSIVFLSLLLVLPLWPLDPYSDLALTARSIVDLDFRLRLLDGIYWSYVLYGISLLLLLVLFSRHDPRAVPRRFLGAPMLFGAVGLILDSLLYLPPMEGLWWQAIFVPLWFLSSAFLVGAALFAMLLGHWYLVQFDLDKKLLRKVAFFYCAALVLRVALATGGFFLYWQNHLLDAGAVRSLISLDGHGIFFWMRLALGILLPVVLAYMIYETARLGANQACTGLLYIAVVFVFMGEMVSRYIFFLKGVPL